MSGVSAPDYEVLYTADGRQVSVPRTSVPQQPVTRLEYRCSPTSGHLYQVQVPVAQQPNVQNNPPPQVAPQHLQTPAAYEWRYDQVTGAPYQVPVQQDASQPRHGPPLGAVLPQQPSQTTSHGHGAGQYAQEVKERVAGIVSLVEGGAANKSKKIIDYAKKCPAKWAKFAKTESLNLPLYVYGTVSELEATLCGRADPLSDEVFLAKIRHLRNVVEVCCINSNERDHLSYGWTLAKDYANKVENEMDQNLSSWLEQPAGVRTDSLLLAQMDFPRPVAPKPRVEIGGKLAGGKIEYKERCRTFNTCSVEMKCEYEVSNPGKSCLLKHECSWCRENLKQGFKHQLSKCRKKD